jgi:tRNA(Arg) A34 adenosine deaminase TadA
MASVAVTMAGLAKTGKNIAGYVPTGTSELNYFVSDNVNLPAVAYLLDSIPECKKALIFTDLPDKHWILTYTGRTVKRVADLGSLSPKDKRKVPDIKSTKELTGLRLKTLAGDRAITAPIPGGGLYDAALRLKGSGGKGTPATGRNKGLERALRYYMLGAYSLLGLCADAGYSEGNYIAAVMVNDKGSILSFGVNTGWFHHGEVNMLLNYFSKDGNKTSETFAENTIVFSTLTPCQQCTNYLLACKPTKSHIYIGQEDTGEFGKAGAAHFEFLDKVTKAPMLLPIQGDALRGRAVHSHLASKMSEGEGTIASKIGENCKTILKGTVNAIDHKLHKSRDTSSEEQAIKEAVLHYLGMWLLTVTLSVS